MGHPSPLCPAHDTDEVLIGCPCNDWEPMEFVDAADPERGVKAFLSGLLLTDQTPLADWCANIAWAVTTEHDCEGAPEPSNPADIAYALYDANEDDPPIAVFTDRETAERVAEALIRVGRTARAGKDVI